MRRHALAVAAAASLLAGGAPPASGAPEASVYATWVHDPLDSRHIVGTCVATAPGAAAVVFTGCGTRDSYDHRTAGYGPVAVATFAADTYGSAGFVCWSGYVVPLVGTGTTPFAGCS